MVAIKNAIQFPSVGAVRSGLLGGVQQKGVIHRDPDRSGEKCVGATDECNDFSSGGSSDDANGGTLAGIAVLDGMYAWAAS
jgi:hypothetical protein